MATPDRTVVVAEIGSTWGRDLDIALRLIDAVVEAGADIVKAQWLSSPRALVERRGAPGYRENYELLEYPLHWLPIMRDQCHARGARFACTAYLDVDLRPVACFGVINQGCAGRFQDGHGASDVIERRKHFVVTYVRDRSGTHGHLDLNHNARDARDLRRIQLEQRSERDIEHDGVRTRGGSGAKEVRTTFA